MSKLVGGEFDGMDLADVEAAKGGSLGTTLNMLIDNPDPGQPFVARYRKKRGEDDYTFQGYDRVLAQVPAPKACSCLPPDDPDPECPVPGHGMAAEDYLVSFSGGPRDGEGDQVGSLAPIDVEGGTYTYTETSADGDVVFTFQPIIDQPSVDLPPWVTDPDEAAAPCECGCRRDQHTRPGPRDDLTAEHPGCGHCGCLAFRKPGQKIPRAPRKRRR